VILTIGSFESAIRWLAGYRRTQSLHDSVADGYAFYGRKLFTSLSPVWTILGVHAATPDGEIVHGFVFRDEPGVRTEETWDTFALRATRSDDTVLEGAVSPASRIVAVLSPQAPGSRYLDSVAAWAVVLTSNVRTGPNGLRLTPAGIAGCSRLSSTRRRVPSAR